MVDHDCDAIHGISGSGMRCKSTNSITVDCTGFTDWFPYFPAIIVTCMATNPPSSGISKDFQVIVLNGATQIFANNAVQKFQIDTAPKLLSKYAVAGP